MILEVSLRDVQYVGHFSSSIVIFSLFPEIGYIIGYMIGYRLYNRLIYLLIKGDNNFYLYY